jgi:gamma-glutamyltranspeptidase/glutathione hydrolase
MKHQSSQTSQVAPGVALGDAAGGYEEMNTNNVSVVDREGNLCSITNTIYGCVYSCSGLFVDGMVLNSAGGHPALPGARLMSPKSPLIVLKNDGPYFACGSSGGITNPFFLLVNVLIWDKNFKEAQEAPRFRIGSSFYTGWGMSSAGDPNRVRIEHRIEDKVARELESRGYKIEWLPPYSMRNAQIAGIDPETGTRYGSADPRGEGMAAGQ